MIRSQIKSLVSCIQPVDQEEAEQVAFVEQWIDSGVEIFRIEKPDTPDPHLAAYCLLIDQEEEKLLLVDHRKANRWIAPGGHIELNEHPKETVSREIVEELGVQADFIWEKPFFLTITQTTGDNDRHTDISLWYILKSSVATPFQYDDKEFHSIRWFLPSEIPLDQSDPNMGRLLKKLLNHNILQFDLEVFLDRGYDGGNESK